MMQRTIKIDKPNNLWAEKRTLCVSHSAYATVSADYVDFTISFETKNVKLGDADEEVKHGQKAFEIKRLLENEDVSDIQILDMRVDLYKKRDEVTDKLVDGNEIAKTEIRFGTHKLDQLVPFSGLLSRLAFPTSGIMMLEYKTLNSELEQNDLLQKTGDQAHLKAKKLAASMNVELGATLRVDGGVTISCPQVPNLLARYVCTSEQIFHVGRLAGDTYAPQAAVLFCEVQATYELVVAPKEK